MPLFRISQRKPNEIIDLQAAGREFPHEPFLPPHIVACLGERLRAYYSQLLNDPIPESFIRILEPMHQKRRADGGR
jgi:hypothetical protein